MKGTLELRHHLDQSIENRIKFDGHTNIIL